MKIWVHINGVQEGPYELSELPLDRMTDQTPVWYEGLDYWMPAGNTELTAPLFNKSHDTADEAQVTVETNKQPSASVQNYARIQRDAANAGKERPANYLIWSVIATVLCCNPVGIIPIVCGIIVNSKYNNYDYEGAKKMSEVTAWFLMITIVTCLISLPFSILLSL